MNELYCIDYFIIATIRDGDENMTVSPSFIDQSSSVVDRTVDTLVNKPSEIAETDTGNVTQSVPPSHILEDGRLVFLPPPNAVERSRFFERSIARHGLLQSDMNTNSNKTKQDVKKILEEDKQQQDDQVDDKNDDKTRPKIHPLAVASARLQSNGLNELNRAINLATLVNTGEFFSYTNVVDPSFESDATGSTNNNNSKSSTDRTIGGGVSSAYYSAEVTTQRTEALFSLKRKRTQFEKASQVLQRHERRLWSSIQAQQVIDRRLFQLRQQWRLVAPEHGTRARLHAARTNEIIAVDVDVYDRDRVLGGNQALMGGIKSKVSLVGRLASRVPRFATIELQDTFKVKYREENAAQKDEDKEEKGGDDSETATESGVSKYSSPRDEKKKNGEKNECQKRNDSENSSPNDDVNMEYNTSEASKKKEDNFATKFTKAEPFAIADPTLGRVIENFDPSKIPMLNLQLDIQKSSTGFLQSACLEPMTTLSSNTSSKFSSADNADENGKNNCDEELLISLQHSLFCANLFESMRSELDPDSTNNNGKKQNQTNNTFSPVRLKTLQSMAWLASESEENYIAPPSFLVGSDSGRGLAALSVVHCHEGEVKVQLDSEYQLCLKLVEANAEETIASPSQPKRKCQVGNSKNSEISGSQSPAQLHAFCRALLVYAQDVYHRHSLYLHERDKKKREDDAAKGEVRGLARIKKEDAPEQARILQSCVSLGSKMLFEQRIRKSLLSVTKWLMNKYGEKLSVEWLSLSIFDLHSKFTLCCRQLVVDGLISRDNLTVTRVNDSEDFRKANFHTEREFEMYIKIELRRQM